MQKIYKILFIIILSISSTLAKDIKPTFIIKSRGLVNDFVIDGFYLYVANGDGSVEIFDIREQKKVSEIFIKPYKNVRGEIINPKVLSVDRMEGKTLIVTTSINGYRNIWIHNGNKLNLINNSKTTAKEARFVDRDKFILGTLGYDITLYSTNDGAYSTYSKQIEESSFSDMAISQDKKSMVSASESGEVTIIDIKSGNIINRLSSLNVDNIYKVAYKKGTIITGGQDRRVGVYPKVGKPYYIKSKFLIYCVGLSDDAKIGVYSSNEDNDLQLFDVSNGKKLDVLKGQDSVPSTIKFFNARGIFSAGYGYNIYYWSL